MYSNIKKCSELKSAFIYQYYPSITDGSITRIRKTCVDTNLVPRYVKIRTIDRDSVELLMNGQCHSLAFVLNREYNMDLYHVHKDGLVHFLCRDPETGYYVDITGARTKKEYIRDVFSNTNGVIFTKLVNDNMLKTGLDKPIIWFARTISKRVMKYIEQRKSGECFGKSKIKFSYGY